MSRRMRRRLVAGLLALPAGVGAAVALPAFAPGDAPPSSASFTAQDYAWHVTGGSAASVTIAVGGTVAFAYPSGASAHNADFSGTAPSSCTQTAGASSGSVPPLPAYPTAHGWTGSCRFDTPGTYSFHCDAHQTMHGTIVIVDPTATTTNTTGTTTPPTTTTVETVPPPTTTSGGSGPSVGRLAHLPARVLPQQFGATLRGRVTTPSAGWHIVVTAFASRRALGLSPSARARVAVGSIRIRATRGERTSFAVALSRAARAALHRHHRLDVTLRIVATLTAPDKAVRGATTRTVVVREAPLPA